MVLWPVAPAGPDMGPGCEAAGDSWAEGKLTGAEKPVVCISGSFVDHYGHSISSEGFLPAVVDIMVI